MKLWCCSCTQHWFLYLQNPFQFRKEIEKINEWFQQEDIDLDEALESYEKGMELIKKRKERLRESENRLEEIKRKYEAEE